MMNSTRCLTLVLLPVVWVFAHGLGAAQIFQNSTPGLFTQEIEEALFLAATDPTVTVQTIDFDELPAGPVASDQYAQFGMTLNTTPPDAPLNPGDATPSILETVPAVHAHSGDRLLYFDSADFQVAENYTIRFSPPVLAVGFWVIDQERNLGATDRLQLFDGNGNTLVDVPSFTNGFVSQELGVQGNMFFGFVSTTPIAEVRMIESIVDTEGVGIDTLHFQPQANPSYPGTAELLVLTSGIAGAPLSDSPFDIKTAAVGDSFQLLLSAFGPLASGVPILVVQGFPTGTAVTSPFPGIAVDPLVAPIIPIFDGIAAGGPFGPLSFPTNGLGIGGTIPPGAGGASFLIQGFSFTSSAANGLFASSNGHELQIL